MKIKLISANFNNHRPLVLNNKTEMDKLGLSVSIYNDVNYHNRSLALQPRLKSKIPKMLEWFNQQDEYDYYIWLDSKFTVNEGFITELINQTGDNDLMLFNHPNRNSIKEELEFMEKLMVNNDDYLKNRYDGEPMREQVEFYLSDNTFIDNKLFACGCFLYTKNLVENKNYNILKEWFLHNTIFSIQDQLSLPYLLQKFNTKYDVFNFNLLNNKFLKYN